MGIEVADLGASMAKKVTFAGEAGYQGAWDKGEGEQRGPIDPLEKLIKNEGGLDEAFDSLAKRLETNPNDVELRRQVNLLLNRLDDLAAKLREKTSN